jgi:hypothetical protein
MHHFLKRALAGAAALAFVSIVFANATTIVYSSIPNLNVNPGVNAYTAYLNFLPLDQFTLSSAASITGLNLVTQNSFDSGLGGFTFEVYDSTHSTIIFSQSIVPTLVTTTAFFTDIITGSVSGLTLSAGTYWAGFYAPGALTLGVAGFAGGNGSLIETFPLTQPGVAQFLMTDIFGSGGGNLGYQLLSGTDTTPLPAALPLFASGLGALGLIGWRRKRKAQAAS